MKHAIKIKRIYEDPSNDDGYRMLVDRLWPRGVRKEDAALDEWNKDIAPSPDLRKWFDHDPDKFEEFTARYTSELEEKEDELKRIASITKKQNLTLLYAAKDEGTNHALVLHNVLTNNT